MKIVICVQSDTLTDMLYIYGVDPLIPLEETIQELEDVVRSGKVRYIGVSNHQVWMVNGQMTGRLPEA